MHHTTVGRSFQEVFTKAKNVEETDDVVEENENRANALQYRMGLYSKIAENINLKEDIWNMGATLLHLAVDLSAKFTGKSRCCGDTNAVPIWRLLLIYQACILHPRHRIAQ